MGRKIIKDTPEYIEKQEMFWHNMFEFFLGLIQRKLNHPINPKKDQATLAKILHRSRLSINRWCNKENIPGSEAVYMDIIHRLLIYFNVPQFPIQGHHLYSVDCEKEFGNKLRKAIYLSPEEDDIPLTIIDSKLQHDSIPEKLRQLIDNPMEKKLLNITDQEIEALSSIRFPDNFRVTVDLYKYLLAYYRGL